MSNFYDYMKIHSEIYHLNTLVNSIEDKAEKTKIYRKIFEMKASIPHKYRADRVLITAAKNNNLDLICFYTGIQCMPTRENALAATIEHLHPQKFGVNNNLENLVIAAKFINNLFGNAPLNVKLIIRDKMKKIHFLHNVSDQQKIKIIRSFVKEELSTYKVDGIPLYPWDWESVRNDDWIMPLKEKNDEIAKMI